MTLNCPLFVLCSLAGLLLLAGGLYLLFKGIIDFKGGQGVSEMALPGGATIKTPAPALVMFALGVVMVVIPVYKSPDLCAKPEIHHKKLLELVELRGRVSGTAHVQVNAVVDEDEAIPDTDFTLSVPFIENRPYTVRYLDDAGNELEKQKLYLSPGETQRTLRGMVLEGTAPPPPVTAKLEQSEPSATVDEFKEKEEE